MMDEEEGTLLRRENDEIRAVGHNVVCVLSVTVIERRKICRC
jgi:hypothetical protein